MNKKDELGEGYSLDDFGLSFDEDAGGSRRDALDLSDSADKINALDLEKLRKSHLGADSHKAKPSGESKNNESKNGESHDYAPQFQGFDFSEVAYDEFSGDSEFGGESSPNITIETNANPRPSVFSNSADEKEALLQPLDRRLSKQSEIGALFVAYAILFLILLLFMPQVYLANNIYYASKNINYLKSQREALRDENGDLQQKLESLKFNFLTLEIEEIK